MAASRLLISLLMSFSLTVNASQFDGFGREIDVYIQEAASRYQVSQAMLRGLIKFEDGWYGKASPTGALGVGQFTKGTWNWLALTPRGQELGMRLITPANQGTKFDPRRHARTNTLATALLARWNLEQFINSQNFLHNLS